MSSVQDIIKCPQCGGCYTTDFDCKTLEEYRFCHRCGKREEYKLVRDEKGEAVLDSEGKPQYVEKSYFGYGCFKLAGKKGISSLYTIASPLTEKTVEDFKKSLEGDIIEVGNCYLTKWDEEKGDVVSVFGAVPPLYDDEMPDEDETDESTNENNNEQGDL